MTTSYDLSTDIGKLRLKIGDNISTYHFQDEELQVFLDDQGSVLGAAVTALHSWAASYATNPDNESIGDYSYTQNVVKKLLDLAAKYETELAATPAADYGTMDL